MSLRVTPGLASLTLAWGPLPAGAYLAIVKWRPHGTGSYTASQPVVAQAILENLPAIPTDIQVVLLPTGGVYSATATPLAPGPPPAPVSVPVIDGTPASTQVGLSLKQPYTA